MSGNEFDDHLRCGGPDECVNDLCRGLDIGMCGVWSSRLAALTLDTDDDEGWPGDPGDTP